MADDSPASHRRDPIKSSGSSALSLSRFFPNTILPILILAFFFPVGNVAAQRRRQNAVTVGKERRESLVRAKRLCRVGPSGDGDVPGEENDMVTDEEGFLLDAQTSSAVEDLKSAIAYQYVYWLI